MTVANERVKEAIEDVQADIKARLGDSRLSDGTLEWEAEWAAEVEGLLARDAGWGWEGFWACVLGNMKVGMLRGLKRCAQELTAASTGSDRTVTM